MSKSKGNCRIDLIIPYDNNHAFPELKDSWIPFVRISNSYNRTLVLKYEIGFCRWICKNGIIFNQKGVTLQITHSIRERIYNMLSSQLNKKGIEEINTIIATFSTKIDMLHNIQVPKELVLSIFCQAMQLQLNKDNLSPKRIDELIRMRKRVNELTDIYKCLLLRNLYKNIIFGCRLFESSLKKHYIPDNFRLTSYYKCRYSRSAISHFDGVMKTPELVDKVYEKD